MDRQQFIKTVLGEELSHPSTSLRRARIVPNAWFALCTLISHLRISQIRRQQWIPHAKIPRNECWPSHECNYKCVMCITQSIAFCLDSIMVIDGSKNWEGFEGDASAPKIYCTNSYVVWVPVTFSSPKLASNARRPFAKSAMGSWLRQLILSLGIEPAQLIDG